MPKDAWIIRDSDTARRVGANGGRKSGEARRRKRDLRETFKAIMDMPVKPGTVDEVCTFAEADGKNVTVGEALAFVIVGKALDGDVRAAEFVRDTAGQRPTTTVEVASSGEGLAEFRAALEAEKARGVPEDGSA